MSEKRQHPNDPLHGINLETMLNELVDAYGWEDLAFRIRINCFAHNPSIKSSPKFIRRTGWARKKIEETYLHYIEFVKPIKGTDE